MLLRCLLTGALTATLLAVGLTVGFGGGQPAATAGDSKYGRVWRDDGVLRKSCRNYKYQYRVKPGSDVWALETFIRDSRGETVASGVLGSGADPKRGTAKFRICRANTVPGKFKLRGKLTWYVTPSDDRVRWVEPDRFRLRRAR